jgi:hypothetical protein
LGLSSGAEGAKVSGSFGAGAGSGSCGTGFASAAGSFVLCALCLKFVYFVKYHYI